jgi:hypothetical protein
MELTAERGISVIMSSHLVADLERVCDYLIALIAGQALVDWGTTASPRGPCGVPLIEEHIDFGRCHPDTIDDPSRSGNDNASPREAPPAGGPTGGRQPVRTGQAHH